MSISCCCVRFEAIFDYYYLLKNKASKVKKFDWSLEGETFYFFLTGPRGGVTGLWLKGPDIPLY